MSVRTTNFSTIGSEKTLRFDVSFIVQQTHNNEYYPFRELFELLPPSSIDENDLYSEFEYCEIGNVDKQGNVFPVNLNFARRNLEDENYYKKIEAGNITGVHVNDILIAKVRPNLKKYVLITPENKDVFFTTAFLRIRPREMPTILYHCLRTVFYPDIMGIARQGKGYPTISEADLCELRFNKQIIDKLRSNKVQLATVISSINQEILQLQSSTTPDAELIDMIFHREFNFDYPKFEDLKAHKTNICSFSELANNPDLRFSAKFHRPSGIL